MGVELWHFATYQAEKIVTKYLPIYILSWNLEAECISFSLLAIIKYIEQSESGFLK